ncbi:MAG: dihydrofolate reductase family protein [Kiritimatiellae bacterium]|nr:dihydrofolate reductase family protein [Kiritimatiellia bacterium]
MKVKTAKRPEVVMFMIETLDGRIDCQMVDSVSGDEYYAELAKLKCDSVLNGRVTMEHYCAEKRRFSAKTAAPVAGVRINKAVEAKGYAISVDTNGVLRWPAATIDAKPLVCIVSEKASGEYLSYLEECGISYIAVGRESIDLKKALAILARDFGVKRIALAGGGTINGGFLEAGLVDEFVFLVAPGIDGRAGQVASVDGIANLRKKPTKLSLVSVRKYPNGTVSLHYRKA